MMKKSFIIIYLFVFALISCNKQREDSIELRINKLIKQMTLDEKVGQMNQLSGVGLSEDMIEMIKSGQVGTLLNEVDIETVNELQRIAVEESRLGIPLIIARDVIHGFKTIFPIPLGQASSWNPEIVKSAARVSAQEASSVGIRWTFAPMIDVTRDPRWGRIAESFGEDSHLTSVMGVAMIEGLQGDTLSHPSSVASCAKHFAAYGATESGKDYNTTWVPEIQLRELYLPPFKAAVDAKAATFMCSFNDINGVPSSGNTFLNRMILRNEWGYNGLVVSDWGSIEQMIPHGFCKDINDAAKKSIFAGIDIDMMSNAYSLNLSELVQSGAVSISMIDEAVANILRLKFKLGLFDNPYTPKPDNNPFYKPRSLELAKQTAIESTILLKNKNNLLPLSENIKKIAVIGSLADSKIDQLGTWCFDAEPENSITPLQALKEQYGSKIDIVYEPTLLYSRDKSDLNFKKAVKAAKESDAVILFVGEEAVLSGEARCRADINLPGAQSELVNEIKKSGKPFTMVVMTGRPLTLEKEVDMADAVLFQFHAGTMTGPAIVDLLFGKAIPSGKLPITLPRMVGQIPIYYSHKKTGRPASNITFIDEIEVGAPQTSLGFTSYFLDAGDTPLFPFGYGLSYTTFNYSIPQLSSTSINKTDTLTVFCRVRNIGEFDASEVVQLYVRDDVGSLVRPVKELKQFKKIFLKKGQTEIVDFQITAEDLSFWNSDMVKRAEPGSFTVWIASDSRSGSDVNFILE